MAIGHLAVRPHTRKRGHSASAGLAYRHGVKLVDIRSGEIHNYESRARQDVVACAEVVAPPRWVGGQDLQVLADAIEKAEKRKDSQLFRDVQVALPHELDEDELRVLTIDFSSFLSKRYDTPVAWAVHRPGRGEPSNIHAHICLPTRKLNNAGDALGEKLRQLSVRPQGPREIVLMRNTWQEQANDFLGRAGEAARVHVGRRLDAKPEPTLPRRATKAQRAAHRDAVARYRRENAWRERRYAEKAEVRVYGDKKKKRKKEAKKDDE